MAYDPSTRVLAVLALAAVALATGCKNSTGACATGSPASLVGTYAEISYTIGATTITGSAVAGGQLRLYATRYGFNAIVPVAAGGTMAFADSGAYVLSGATCISWTSVLGQPVLSGTYTLVADTLAVTGTAATETVANVWIKQ